MKTSHEIYWTMVLGTEQAPTNTIVQWIQCQQRVRIEAGSGVIRQEEGHLLSSAPAVAHAIEVT